jgi:hypothetical protein
MLLQIHPSVGLEDPTSFLDGYPWDVGICTETERSGYSAIMDSFNNHRSVCLLFFSSCNIAHPLQNAPIYPTEPPEVDISLESELQTVLYDVQKARRTVAKLSEPVMQELDDAKKSAEHLRILMEERVY